MFFHIQQQINKRESGNENTYRTNFIVCKTCTNKCRCYVTEQMIITRFDFQRVLTKKKCGLYVKRFKKKINKRTNVISMLFSIIIRLSRNTVIPYLSIFIYFHLLDLNNRKFRFINSRGFTRHRLVECLITEKKWVNYYVLMLPIRSRYIFALQENFGKV